MRRISLAIYEIILKYKEGTYKLYLSSDGKRRFCTEPPRDDNRMAQIESKREEIRSFVPWGEIGTDFLGILGILACICVVAGAFYWLDYEFNSIIASVITIILAIVALKVVLMIIPKMTEAHDESVLAWETLRKELNQLTRPMEEAYKKFNAEKIPFKGVFSDLTGDEKAFFDT